MIARLTMLLLIGLGIAALAVGCGGGGDSSTTTITTSSLSKPQFVKQANAICERGRSKFVKSVSSEPPFAESIEVVVVPMYEEIIEQIREIGAPKGDAAEIEAFLAAMQEGAETLEAKSASFKTLSDLEPPLEKSAKIAGAYGIKLCAFAFV